VTGTASIRTAEAVQLSATKLKVRVNGSTRTVAITLPNLLRLLQPILDEHWQGTPGQAGRYLSYRGFYLNTRSWGIELRVAQTLQNPILEAVTALKTGSRKGTAEPVLIEALAASPADVAQIAHYLSQDARKDLVQMVFRLAQEDASRLQRRGPKGDEISRIAQLIHISRSTVKLWRDGEIPSDQSTGRLLEILGGDARTCGQIASLVALDAEGYHHHARAWCAAITPPMRQSHPRVIPFTKNRTAEPVLIPEARP
jgi:hypothetical protein